MLSSTEPEIHAVDISETDLRQKFPEALEILLRDHTTKRNIFWATDDYKSLGPGYAWHDPICAPLITGDRGKVIMPRVKKDRNDDNGDLKMGDKDFANIMTANILQNAGQGPLHFPR